MGKPGFPHARAASLAATIRERAGIDAEAVEGAKSQFDVLSDGTLLFSKQAEGRFPEEDEILDLLA